MTDITPYLMACRYCRARPGKGCVGTMGRWRGKILTDDRDQLRFHPHRTRDAKAASLLRIPLALR